MNYAHILCLAKTIISPSKIKRTFPKKNCPKLDSSFSYPKINTENYPITLFL